MSDSLHAVETMRQGSRGRAHGSAEQLVRESGLPAELQLVVLGVVGRCRLWRHERVEVARELCGHFLDGLESGAGALALAEGFGDAAVAARLISASRKRMRPAWWRAWRMTLRTTGWMFAVFAAVYCVLGARYFLSRPVLRHNYMAELNAAVLAIPEHDRAWPEYVRAIREFGKLPEYFYNREADPTAPGDEKWAELVSYLKDHAGALEVVRGAANRRDMGFEYRATMDPELGRAMEVRGDGYKYDASAERGQDNPVMIGILLPYLGELRRFDRWLSADALLAAESGDGARVVADIGAELGIAGQCLKEKFLISQLVGIAVGQHATENALELFDRPGLLDGAQLRGLAHRLASLGGGRLSVDASCERLMIDDLVQRFFSDDGHGDGHLVDGAEQALFEDFGVARPRLYGLLRAARPLQSVAAPSRARVGALVDALAAGAARDDALPPWEHHLRTSDDLYSGLMGGVISRLSPVVSSLFGGLQATGRPIAASCAARDMLEASRWGAMTAIAIESYRRANGYPPASLEVLVPACLPSVPLDPFDGRALRYRPAGPGGSPVLYSVGVDGVDDGGRAPASPRGRKDVRDLYGLWNVFRQTDASKLTGPECQKMDAARGDWILWPARAGESR